MRRRWHRELIEQMREENRRRREEHQRWLEENRRRREEHQRWLEENRRRREAHERWLVEWREESKRWLVEWRAREEADAKEQKRRFDSLDAAMENDKRVTREIVLELQAARARDKDMLSEMRAQRQGLLRMLDRLDGNDGPSPAGA
jgi:hypothetical protein